MKYLNQQSLFKSTVVFLISLLLLANLTTGCNDSPKNKEVAICINTDSPLQNFGATKLEAALRSLDLQPVVVDIADSNGEEKIRLVMADEGNDQGIKKEGYRIQKAGSGYVITAVDNTGGMYGLLEIAEQIEMKEGIRSIEEKQVNPRFEFRAIKYNLPWVSYRENESLQANEELSRDLDMWASFLDMMAENRFNALTLCSLHPFPYMIRAENFPKATPFSDAELAEWKTFWTQLFRMARERGIDTYIVNWNIIVSKSFREHFGEGNTGLWADG